MNCIINSCIQPHDDISASELAKRVCLTEPTLPDTLDEILNTEQKESKPTLTKQSNYTIAVAIDFGTDGTAMAYAYGNKVFIHDKWSSRKYGHEIKQKTVILLDNKG
eukprot:127756_1